MDWDNLQLWFKVTALIEEKDFEGANELLDDMIAQDPDNVHLIFAKSICLDAMGKFSEALEMANKARESGDNIVPDEFCLLRCDIIGILSPFRKGIDLVVDPEPAKFRSQHSSPAVFPAGADDQFAFPDVDGQLFTGIFKSLRGAEDMRLTFCPPEGFGPAPGSLIGNMGFGTDIMLTDFFDSFCNCHNGISWYTENLRKSPETENFMMKMKTC